MTRMPVRRTAKRSLGNDEVNALARGLTVLRCVGRTGSISNRELSAQTGIPKATVSRITATLVRSGFLKQVADSEKFALAPAVLDLGNDYLRRFDLRSAARTHLVALAEGAGATALLGVRDRLDMVLIECIRPTSATFFSRVELGMRVDLCTSAIGKAYLSVLPQAERATLLDGIRIASGERWITIREKLLRGLEEANKFGFCTSLGESAGSNAIAVPLVSPTGEYYGISCGGPSFLLTHQILMERVAPLLLKCAEDIAAEIGGISSPRPPTQGSGEPEYLRQTLSRTPAAQR